MSKKAYVLLLSASIAVGVGALSTAMAQSQPQQQQPQAQQPRPPQQPQPPQQQSQQQGQQPQAQNLQQLWQMQRERMRARISAAMQQLGQACKDEIRNFCSTVTPGEGRLLLCMQAHDDKIGGQCELALIETSRNVGTAVRRMENLAQACWQDIKTHCSGASGSVVQCMMDKRASLSGPCQAMVAAILPDTRQGRTQPDQPSMIGLAVYSADGMMLGQITGVRRRADGSLDAIEAELGRPLGMGAIEVLISPDDLQWRGDGVELQMVADQVRSILQGQQR